MVSVCLWTFRQRVKDCGCNCKSGDLTIACFCCVCKRHRQGCCCWMNMRGKAAGHQGIPASEEVSTQGAGEICASINARSVTVFTLRVRSRER